MDRLAIRRVDVAAQLAPDSVARVKGFSLLGRDLVVGDTLLVAMDSLGAEIAPPGEPALWFTLAAAGEATPEVFRLDPLRISSHRSDISGHAVLPRSFDVPRMADRLDVKLEARPLALADLASVYPAVPPEGDLTFQVGASAKGRLVTAQLAARLDSAAIDLEGSTVVGRGAPAVYRVRGKVKDLDPSRLHRSAPIGAVNGEVEADIRGETLALADGNASLRLRGSRVADTDLRGLDFNAALTRGRADLRLRGDVLGGSVRANGMGEALRFGAVVPTRRGRDRTRGHGGGREDAGRGRGASPCSTCGSGCRETVSPRGRRTCAAGSISRRCGVVESACRWVTRA